MKCERCGGVLGHTRTCANFGIESVGYEVFTALVGSYEPVKTRIAEGVDVAMNRIEAEVAEWGDQPVMWHQARERKA